NDTDKDYPKDKLIHEIFEENAQRYSNRIALVHGPLRMTYDELNKKANSVAHHLIRTKKVKKGDVVGLMIERSPQMIAGLLGIIKAGAAYVPIDNDYPDDRIKYIINDSHLSLILTSGNTKDQLYDCDQLNVDNIFNSSFVDNPGILIDYDQLAYLIYTSGSTGAPKGVQICHKSIINFSFAMNRAYDVSKEDCILQFATISFDTSLEEILPALTTGASLVLRSDRMLDGIKEFIEEISQSNVTICTLPTAFWQVLTNEIVEQNLSLPSSLRIVGVTGEALKKATVEKWLDIPSLDHIKLVNTYGPTEATVNATMTMLNRELIDGYSSIPIGRPLDNLEVYILDSNLNMQPVGVIGELCISGIQLSAGYLNNDAQNKERFVENPFRKEALLYKTGDLAKWRPDGNVEYIGRIDDQVKLRGFRIELGEIENALSKIEGIKGAVVTVPKKKDGTDYLCGYYTASEVIKESHIIQQLRASLPEYMIPFSYVFLNEFPLTPNGKISKKDLPVPVANESKNYFAPKSELELVMTEIWYRTLLSSDRQLGTRDNFFEVGGDSIKAIQ
ncbi:non-ribosomal peptide synthetase, partial [Fulvivirga kasyanovii]